MERRPIVSNNREFKKWEKKYFGHFLLLVSILRGTFIETGKKRHTSSRKYVIRRNIVLRHIIFVLQEFKTSKYHWFLRFRVVTMLS